MKELVFNNWKIEKEIGSGRYATVYLASKIVDGVKAKCAVKHISIPKEGETVEDLVKAGVIKDVSEAKAYYSEVLSDVKKDFMIMEKFEDTPGILKCYEYAEEYKDNNQGIDIYIRMELANDINVYFKDGDASEEEVLKLGYDITEALKACEKKKIIHKDIKPSNIFISEDFSYKLGDFGGAMTSAFIGKSRKITGTYSYMSPEVYNKEDTTSSTDTYSLGIVMYQLLNRGYLPFQEDGLSISEATKKRLAGEKIESIPGVNYEVMNIVLKACSFDVKDRYQSAKEMNDDISKLMVTSKKTLVSSKRDEKTVSVYDVGVLEKETTNINEIELMKKASGNKIIGKVVNNKNAEKISNNKVYGFFANVSRKNEKKKKLGLVLVILLLLLLLLFFGMKLLFTDCDKGYVKDGFKCVKGYYYCEEGYSLNKDNKCAKTIESIDAKVSYSCSDGYILNGDQCVKNDTKEPTDAYRCGDGFTLKNQKCVAEIRQPANASLYCKSGYTLVDNKCIKVTTKDAKVTYKCNSGYVLNGTICTGTFYDSNKVKTNYTCNSSCTISSDKKTCNCSKNPTMWGYYPTCEKGTYDYKSRKCVYTETPKITYSCTAGEYVNSTCKITSKMNATASYYCDSGYEVVVNKCVKTEGVAPQVKYSCIDGMTLKGKECRATQTVDAIKTFGCDSGYTFTGTSCVLQETKKAEAKYSCSRVYELNEENKKCEKYEIIRPKVHREEK